LELFLYPEEEEKEEKAAITARNGFKLRKID